MSNSQTIYNEFKAASDKYVADQELLKQQTYQKVKDYIIAEIRNTKQQRVELIENTGERRFCVAVPWNSIPYMGRLDLVAHETFSTWGRFVFNFLMNNGSECIFEIRWD